MKKLTILAAAAMLTAAVNQADACSRVVFLGDSTSKDIVMVGRTLDWRTPIPTNIYVYPAGVEKQSMPEGPMYRWISKYGSVVAVSYDGGITEGLNDQGLVMNSLFCKTAVYRTPEIAGSGTPVMSLSVIISYFLDNFATVDEVAQWLETNDFAIAGKTFDSGTVSLLHFGLTDRSGETLLMEYVDGKLTTYRGRDLLVLTNDPNYTDMKAINKYWQNIGGTHMLPGTVTSPDRFVRADFFINHVPKAVSTLDAWAELSSIMAYVSVPMGYELPGSPNVSSTQWRSISDCQNLKYYFKFADSMGDFYVDMGSLLLKRGAPILKLDTSDHSNFAGCINHELKHSEGFKPMW